MNVITAICHFARTRPDAPAIIEGSRTITYRDLAALVARTATQLSAIGSGRHDRIGLCLKDSSAHIVTLLAAGWIGSVPVPLDWRASSMENARLIDRLGPRCIIAEPDSRLPPDCAGIALDGDWNRAVERARPYDGPLAEWNDPFVISASSGSTGAPKFTQMTHLQYYFAVAGMFEAMNLTGRHRYLCALPLYYSGGRNSCIAHLMRGDCIILYPSLFRADEYVEVAHRHQATVGFVVASVVRQLLAIDKREPLLPGMAALFCGGAPLGVEEKLLATRRLTANFHERYGTAETLVVTVLRPEDMAAKAASIGQPHSLVEIGIADEDDGALPLDATGLLRIRGPGVGSPVFGDAHETHVRGGWFYPGEIARLDEQGFIFLLGRASDVIIRGGAKIFPSEIEAALREHPAIADAAVIGHRTSGPDEAAVAFVVPRGTLSIAEILAHCRHRLTPHKVPRQFRLVRELPRLTSEKIDKAALARLLDAETE